MLEWILCLYSISTEKLYRYDKFVTNLHSNDELLKREL